MSEEKNNQISKEDRNIYMLAMAQTLILACYYLLFEEFFMLATIRNLLIWIAIHVLVMLCEVYWIEDKETLARAKKVIYLLMIINFILWFFIAVGDGSALVNTNFNLGYNCRLIDWVVLSGFLLVMTATQAALAYNIVDRLNWEQKHKADKNDQASIQEEKENIMMIVGGSVVGALIMFMWDYLAYMMSDTDEMCVEVFSGNTFFRKILCFLLKIISMQALPSITYFAIYHRKKNQFLSSQIINFNEGDGPDILNDDIAS